MMVLPAVPAVFQTGLLLRATNIVGCNECHIFNQWTNARTLVYIRCGHRISLEIQWDICVYLEGIFGPHEQILKNWFILFNRAKRGMTIIWAGLPDMAIAPGRNFNGIYAYIWRTYLGSIYIYLKPMKIYWKP